MEEGVGNSSNAMRRRNGWPRRARVPWAAALAVLAALFGGCNDGRAWGEGAKRTPPGGRASGEGVERLRVEVLARHPHDSGAFTQGLLWHDGRLYESTGLRGHSSVREVDLPSGRVLRERRLDATLFGEGLARVGSELIQLTWTRGVALRWGLADFSPKGRFGYQGEGWGLCFDGRWLVMSDGSEWLTFRDPTRFEARRRVRVTLHGRPVRRLNELECVAGAVYANVWTTDRIVRIDPESGRVTALVDASGLLPAGKRPAGADVLNGIAWIPERARFVLTGKRWPWLFEVRFVPAGDDAARAR